MVFLIGIEPMTESLEGFCSNPTELQERKIYNYLILYYSIVNSFLKIAHC